MSNEYSFRKPSKHEQGKNSRYGNPDQLEERPEIWDKFSEYYKDRNKKSYAWKSLLQISNNGMFVSQINY